MKNTKLFVIILTFSALFFSTTLFAAVDDNYRVEINANPYQNGDAFDIGISTPYLFKFRAASRHRWSLFTTLGANTLYNTIIQNESDVAETINFEVVAGLRALAPFYGDFISQYGKIAIDAIFYDENVSDEGLGLGGLFETGLEFNSSVTNLSYHVGVRWRFGLPANNQIDRNPDQFEGVSMVLGSRFSF